MGQSVSWLKQLARTVTSNFHSFLFNRFSLKQYPVFTEHTGKIFYDDLGMDYQSIKIIQAKNLKGVDEFGK